MEAMILKLVPSPLRIFKLGDLTTRVGNSLVGTAVGGADVTMMIVGPTSALVVGGRACVFVGGCGKLGTSVTSVLLSSSPALFCTAASTCNVNLAIQNCLPSAMN